MEDHFQPLPESIMDGADEGKGIDILYVSPSEPSLSNFSNICKSAHYPQHIRHVIFIPRALGNGYRNMNQTIGQTISQALYEGILSLPKLNTISVRNHITEPGLNADPQRLSIAIKTNESRSAGINPSEFIVVESLGSLDIIFDALVSLSRSNRYQNNVRAFNLGNGHSDPLYGGQLPVNFGFDELLDVFANFAKLAISADVFREEYVVSEFWEDVCHAACNLQELTIYVDTAIASRDEGYGPVTQIFLEQGDFQQLERLRIYGVRREPGVIHADSFVNFARKHRTTLDGIILQGFLLSNDRVDEDVGHTMTVCLSTLRNEFRDEFSLSKFEMLVHRRDEHNKWSCTNGGHNVCNGHCKGYKFRHRVVGRVEIDQVARQLGVSLGTQGWNFGDFVLSKSNNPATTTPIMGTGT